jgi:hypothetical protein
VPRPWGRLLGVALIALLAVRFLFRSNAAVSSFADVGIGVIGLLIAWYALSREVTRDEKWVEEIRHGAIEDVRLRGTTLWLGCLHAKDEASEVEDPDHPEWRRIGRYTGDDFSVIFVEAAAPRSPGRRTSPTTRRKWYLGIPKPNEPIDSYAVFGEVTRHYLAPGAVSLAVDEDVETWARDELNAPLTFAIMFTDSSTA